MRGHDQTLANKNWVLPYKKLHKDVLFFKGTGKVLNFSDMCFFKLQY